MNPCKIHEKVHVKYKGLDLMMKVLQNVEITLWIYKGNIWIYMNDIWIYYELWPLDRAKITFFYFCFVFSEFFKLPAWHIMWYTQEIILRPNPMILCFIGALPVNTPFHIPEIFFHIWWELCWQLSGKYLQYTNQS